MEVIKWGTPVYEKAGLVICSLRAASQHVALQFGSIGTRLHDPDGLLEGTGKKMRHVKVRTSSDIKKKLFAGWIKKAASSVT